MLTVKSIADFVATGTSTANASTTIAGAGTLYLKEIGIGDRISLSSASSTYATVTAIASDTSLTVDAALGNGTSQTINVKKSLFRAEDSSGTIRALINDLGKTTVYNQFLAPGGINPQWTTAKTYSVDDLVLKDSYLIRCLTAHTSGTYTTDVQSGYWQLAGGAKNWFINQ